MHLLMLFDYVLYLLECLRQRRANRMFVHRHPDFSVPPSKLAFEAFGYTNNDMYYRTGVEHAQFVVQLVKKHVEQPEPRVCEWGCGPGRIIRHLPRELASQKATIFGIDFNPRSIAWCRQNIIGVRFESNELHPPLPFSDDFFDFIYALSVFTHLDESGWKEWMNELSRVTKKDGVVLFTTHGQNYLHKMLSDEKRAFLSGSPVFRAKSAVGKKSFSAYHPSGFVHANLPPQFRVLSHEESSSVFALSQDIWVVRKTCANKLDAANA